MQLLSVFYSVAINFHNIVIHILIDGKINIQRHWVTHPKSYGHLEAKLWLAHSTISCIERNKLENELENGRDLWIESICNQIQCQ